MNNQFKKQYTEVRNLFVNTPYLRSILQEIDSCRQDSLLGGEPDCMLITGYTGAGKTSLIQRYLDIYPSVDKENKTVVSVLYTTLPENASPISASQQMLKDLNDPFYCTSNNAVLLNNRLVTLLKNCETELIIIDEFQHMIERRSSKILFRAADWLKTLIVRSKVPVVMFGMPNSKHILEANSQLARRFILQRVLKPFRVIDEKEREFYLLFLSEVDKALPFKKTSQLASKAMALPLYAFCRGNMGRLRKLINLATKIALLEDHLKIELTDFMKATESLLSEKFDNPFMLPLSKITYQEPKNQEDWDDYMDYDHLSHKSDNKVKSLNDIFSL